MSELLELTDAAFEESVLNETRPVLVDFWSPTCVPCRFLAPVLQTLAQTIGDVAVIAKVDASSNVQLALKYKIDAVPTLILFKNGQVVARLAGVQKLQKLQELIEKHL
ncbi:MAG: thioredoxin [Planctomycetia bacterium]|nr:thioredoxin [Planctomycetia bacterium]